MARLKRPAQADHDEAVSKKRTASGAEDGYESGDQSDSAEEAPPVLRRSSRAASAAATKAIYGGNGGSNAPATRARAAPAALAKKQGPTADPAAPKHTKRALSVMPANGAVVAPANVAPTLPPHLHVVRIPPATPAAAAPVVAAAAVAAPVAVAAARPPAVRPAVNGHAAAAVAPIAVAVAVPAQLPAARQVINPAPPVAAAVPIVHQDAIDERRIQEEQAAVDEKVATFIAELSRVNDGPRPTTTEEYETRKEAMLSIFHRARRENDLLRDVGYLQRSTMQMVVDETLRQLDEIFIKLEVMAQERARRQREAEEERRRKIQEDLRKKAEEEERAKAEEAKREKERAEEEERKRVEEKERREREERERREASIIDKECKICYNEVVDGVGCVLCRQVIGCKTCMDDWLVIKKNCPHCCQSYSHPSKQVKRVAGGELEAAIKLAAMPRRRSSRGRMSLD